ncbi:MAG: hypothetical protein ACOYJG_00350 [Prevotella sp.]|jgi:hypothetical protein
MNENSNMTAERSLEIISQMVENTRQRVEVNGWKPMLYWGLVTITLALVVGYLWQNTKMGPAANLLWILESVGAIYPLFNRSKQPAQPTTYLSKSIGTIWKWLGIICGLLAIIWSCLGTLHAYLPPLPWVNNHFIIPIVGIVVMLMGLGSTITGSLLKIRSIMACGVITAVLGGTLGLIIIGPQQMLFLALCIFVALVIPALIIRKNDKSCSSH